MFVPSFFFKGRVADNASQTSGSSANSGYSAATAQPGVGRRETSAKYAETDVSTAQWSDRSTSQDDSTTQHRSGAATRPTPSTQADPRCLSAPWWTLKAQAQRALLIESRSLRPLAPRGGRDTRLARC